MSLVPAVEKERKRENVSWNHTSTEIEMMNAVREITRCEIFLLLFVRNLTFPRDTALRRVELHVSICVCECEFVKEWYHITFVPFAWMLVCVCVWMSLGKRVTISMLFLHWTEKRLRQIHTKVRIKTFFSMYCYSCGFVCSLSRDIVRWWSISTCAPLALLCVLIIPSFWLVCR